MRAIGLLNKQEYKKYIDIVQLQADFASKSMDYVDLSELDLRDYGDLFMSHPTGPFSQNGIHGWTSRVIWPSADKMPPNFNPHTIMEQAKHPDEIDGIGATGRGINIAVIDNPLYASHPEYANNIKYHQKTMFKMKEPNRKHFHGSMVLGCAVGKTTGVAPDANIYYFEQGKKNEERGKEMIAILQSILDFNSKQKSADKKINILSWSWTPKRITTTPEEYTQVLSLLQQIESQNIKIIFCGDDDIYPESYSVSKSDYIPCDKHTNVGGEKTEYQNVLGIPTNEKTVPMVDGGYLYQKLGGDSSAPPYLAGVYACALQGNQIFMQRPDWQKELNDILAETALEAPNGGRIINPKAIRNHVSEISRQMEMAIFKQNSKND